MVIYNVLKAHSEWGIDESLMLAPLLTANLPKPGKKKVAQLTWKHLTDASKRAVAAPDASDEQKLMLAPPEERAPLKVNLVLHTILAKITERVLADAYQKVPSAVITLEPCKEPHNQGVTSLAKRAIPSGTMLPVPGVAFNTDDKLIRVACAVFVPKEVSQAARVSGKSQEVMRCIEQINVGLNLWPFRVGNASVSLSGREAALGQWPQVRYEPDSRYGETCNAILVYL